MKIYFKKEHINENINEYPYVIEVYSDSSLQKCVGCFYFDDKLGKTSEYTYTKMCDKLSQMQTMYEVFDEYTFIEGIVGYVGNLITEHEIDQRYNPIPRDILLRPHSIGKI